jgi:hypothetical protein
MSAQLAQSAKLDTILDALMALNKRIDAAEARQTAFADRVASLKADVGCANPPIPNVKYKGN